MSQTASQTITILRTRCPQCHAPVKISSHKGDTRYFACICGHKFKGVVR